MIQTWRLFFLGSWSMTSAQKTHGWPLISTEQFQLPSGFRGRFWALTGSTPDLEIPSRIPLHPSLSLGMASQISNIKAASTHGDDGWLKWNLLQTQDSYHYPCLIYWEVTIFSWKDWHHFPTVYPSLKSPTVYSPRRVDTLFTISYQAQIRLTFVTH